MTGVQLLAYLKRRLAEAGLTVTAERDDELYDNLTEGRDELLQAFSLAAPVVVKTTITLEVDPADDRIYNFAAAAKDPYRVLEVRDKESHEPLTPAATLNVDGGDYAWDSIRRLWLAEHVGVAEGVEVVYVPAGVAIDAATTEAQVGLPTTCHRAVGKFAAVLALTADEESDAKNATALYQRELEKLERIYGEFDASGGFSLREALMESAGNLMNDTLY
jgi:hypothetical protein